MKVIIAKRINATVEVAVEMEDEDNNEEYISVPLTWVEKRDGININ